MTEPRRADLGYFGNIWVKQNILDGAGSMSHGHEHLFDHVSLLVEGTVEVHVAGAEPTQFVAPTFIVIRKQHQHHFKAVTDRVVWYCVYALRDFEGEVIEDLYGVQHDPLAYSAVNSGYWERAQKLDEKTSL